jgi:hypothetical protein
MFGEHEGFNWLCAVLALIALAHVLYVVRSRS